MAEYLKRQLGAQYLGEGRTQFFVWAPRAETLAVEIQETHGRRIPLTRLDRGYYHGTVDGVEPGTRYLYSINGRELRPDPASRYQPESVHGPSEVIDPRFPWSDDHWHGLPLRDYVMYELHVGTFTPQGTFEAIIERLGYLKSLGVNCIELMPVAQNPGNRNWGYDGVYPYASQASYGGPDGLRKLIDACHNSGIGVCIDVVYNHLGPEGNYLGEFGHYFTDKYHTPWGSALNFDGPHSDEVRRYFIQNALFWVRDFHADALRLDAVHAIYDESSCPFLRELGEDVREEAELLNRRVYTIAESHQNDWRHVQPGSLGGYALDSQWVDDFHHILHVLFTGEQAGYYEDYGPFATLAEVYRDGVIYSGQYSPFRKRRHGTPCAHLSGEKFVVFAQNHDQVGNRRSGERLSQLVSYEEQKLSAGLLLFSPYVPMLFMGEEYGETAPFLYFISHLDPQLIDSVREGRRAEFADFAWEGDIPDPQSEETFNRCKINLDLRTHGKHRELWELHQLLIRLRKTIPALRRGGKHDMKVALDEERRVLSVRRYYIQSELQGIFHLGKEPARVDVAMPAGTWETLVDSATGRWAGPGSNIPERVTSQGKATLDLAPSSFVLLQRIVEGGESQP